MPKEKITKENLYIYYNSLISICTISETNMIRSSKFLLRIENLEQTLLLKHCTVPLSDFSDLKESLFYIREIDDEDVDKETNNNIEDSSENKRINFNQPFILQHMISKKYIYLYELLANKNYILKLTSNKDEAVPIILKRIHETRNSQEFLTFNQSFCISIYIKAKDQYYYLNANSYTDKFPEYDIDTNMNGNNNFYVSNENIISNKRNLNNINNNNNNNIFEYEDDSYNSYSKFYKSYSELCIEEKMNCKYRFLNQSWYINYQDRLFSSHIINILFINSNLYKDTSKNNVLTEKEEKLMLSAEYIENINVDEVYDINQVPLNSNENVNKKKRENYFYDENKGLINLGMDKKKLENQTRVKLVPYETDFYKHVINNSFWVIEEELVDERERLEKEPLKEETQIKIKNVLLGLYLKVKKKGNDIEIEEMAKNGDENNNTNENMDNNKESDIEEEAEYEFELVDGETISKNNFFFGNFKIFHYSIDENRNYMTYKGKYALRNIFKEDKNENENFDFKVMNNYFQPLSINLDSEKKYYLIPKNEDDYLFEINRVDIFEANHVIYMNKLIHNFNFYLDKCINNEIRISSAIRVIVSNLSFLIDYLINVEYIFRDENYDLNQPIEQRQVILANYGVLKIIRKIAEYLLPFVIDMNSKNKSMYQMRKTNRNKKNNNISLYSSLAYNTDTINNNMYRIDTFNQKLNINNLSVVNMKKIIKIILDFLTYLSNNNEEIKEKIFLDLDVIFELAEKVFILDKSLLLNFIFKLIKHSEVLQEYITGGKLNLLFTIKNSNHYKNYTEKESQNKLIRMDKILLYIETSNNYLYYYKKLLKLDKVKHKKDQIKQLILDHMRKVENEYQIKYNYKKNMINIINRTKIILNRIEKPLLKDAEKEDKEAEINKSKKKTRKILQKQAENFKNKDDKKSNSEEVSNLYGNEKSDNEIRTSDNILSTENNQIKNNDKKDEKHEKDKSEPIKKAINLLQSWPGLGDKDDNKEDNNEDSNEDDNSIIEEISKREEKINQKTKIEESLTNIKSFLSFFEDYNINNILFIQEECYQGFFNSFNGIKNLTKNLDFVVEGKNKSYQLIDGIKLDTDSELGQLIPFNLFNKYFPKFYSKKNKNIKQYNNIINDNFDEDSENDLYNDKDNDSIQEKTELEDDSINNAESNNKNIKNIKLNFLSNENNPENVGKNYTMQNAPILFNKLSKNITNDNNKKKLLRRSGTNVNLIRNSLLNNHNIDETLLGEIEKNQMDEDITKLNKNLCILYTTYQFCINEFYECLLTVFNMLNNYFINYREFCDMDIFSNNLKKIRENLITKIAFIKNDVLTNLYSGARKKPTLLKGVFDFDNFLVSCSEKEKNKLNSSDENKDLDEIMFIGDKYDFSSSKRIKNKKHEGKKLKEIIISEELTLIKSLFSFCKKYDKIVYMNDKINCFRCIKKLINNVKDNKNTSPLKSNDTLTTDQLNYILENRKNNTKLNIFDSNENENYIIEFLNIIDNLNKKRNDILLAYIDINNCKKFLSDITLKNQKDKSIKSLKSIGYDINKRSDIIIRLMMKYEIEYIFGKLIYLGSNNNSIYLENNILRNFKNVQKNFQEIKNEIKKIKIDYDRRGDNCFKIIKDENNNLISQLNFNDSDFNKNHFQEVNICLSKMTNNFLNFLRKNSSSISRLKSMPKLNKILYIENDYFYKKIGFEKIMQGLIEAIDYFYDFNRNPKIKLNYCQEILRIFLDIQNIYKNFKVTISTYFNLYYKMIMSSLHTINLYQDNLTGKEEEKYFLKICYYSCESFMIVILNSEKNFDELRGFMIDILTKLIKIYSHLTNPKNKIIFQILYTYYISRVLIFISKEKYYDEFSYNSFFQIVYPMELMHEQIFNCMKELEKNEEEEEDSSEEKEISEENDLSKENKKLESKKVSISGINTISNNLEKNKNLNNIIKSIDKNDLHFHHYNKYYQSYLQEKQKVNTNQNNSNNNVQYPQDTIKAINEDEEIIWESDEEKEKFGFYLNYLSIYLLYLHDRNSMKKKRDNENKQIILNSIEYNYKNLYSKIQKILGNFEKPNITKEDINIKTFNSNEISHKMKTHFIETTLNTQNFQKNLKSKKNFQFESILVESIILYKYRLNNQIIEIPVKNRKIKTIDEEVISNAASEDKTSSISGKIVELRNKEMITFYYYDNEFIDLILLEKICNDVNLKETLNYYCTDRNMFNEYYVQKDDLMKIVLNMKTECKLLMSYYKGEYKILHDQFIQNDMEQFIMLLKTRFTNRDFNSIYSMKKFLYRKMNEIYSDDLFYGIEAYNEKKIISFIDQFKLIEKLNYLKNKVYNNIYLYSFLTSLIYLYPRYPKKTCVLYYLIGFKLLSQRCKLIELEENKNNRRIYDRESKKESTLLSHTKANNIEEKYQELDKIIEGFILLFSRKINRNVMQDDDDFFLMINSLIEFLKELKRKKIYLMKSGPLITQLFTVLDFVFDHLFRDFEKIINFMKSAENQKLRDKFRKKETNLKIIIMFISNILSLQKASDNNLLTDNIIRFIQNLTGQIIKLILILIEIGKEDSMKTCDMLIDFIYFFIEGPNINNLNSLFSYGFFNLLNFIITNIDYYKIFLNNINRINLHNIIDNYAKIEQKIIKIFFVYYNVAYNNTENTKEYSRVREWYDNNYNFIKIKLKKLYHFSNVEMEKRSFDIDRALIYKKPIDEYTKEELFLRAGILNKSEIDEISFEDKLNNLLEEDNLNEIKINNNIDNENNLETDNRDDIYQINKNSNLLYNDKNILNQKNDYCLIKFDLILMYYSLHMYYKDIINEEYFKVGDPTDSFCTDFVQFLLNFVIFIKDVFIALPALIIFFYQRLKEKAKAKVDILQELNKIDEDILSINETDMILNLSSKIKCVEISINQILYKIYFPLINNAKKIEEKTDYYLYVENDKLPEYVSHIIRNYDKIYIMVTKNNYFDKLAKIPMLNLIFKNINLFGIFLMIIGIISNLLILVSYSDFNTNRECDCGEGCRYNEKRLHCPRFFFNGNRGYTNINRTLRFFGIIQLIFQIMVMLDHVARNFSINYALSKQNYIIEKAKKKIIHCNSKFCDYFKIIIIAIIHTFTFQFIYYILYILFMLLGIFNHPFYYCFSLFELINRVEVMLSVVKAIYVPGIKLLVNLLMLIMLEYLFSLFSLSFFTSHFPNIKDSKNFLQTYMRMLDQTFKQDGGIGTYLDQSLDPNYEQYTPKAYAGGRYWFDLLFYIIIILIIFQIFTSIIIDYFMETRKNREEFNKKTKTKCLVCGLKRENIEKIYLNIKDGFNKHRVYCHHIMNYINYLFYVQSLSYRDPIIEQGIWNYHLENNNIFLPIKSCFQMKEKKILDAINEKQNDEKEM